MDEINEFRLFLIQNNALESYLKNVDNNRINRYYLDDERFIRIIDASFVWHRTPEGEDYWLELHRKWMKQVNPNRKVDYTNIVEKLLSTGVDYDNLWEDLYERIRNIQTIPYRQRMLGIVYTLFRNI